MEPIRIRCRSCSKELVGRVGKTVSCGCPNITTIRDGENISAVDLSQIVMLNSYKSKQSNNVLKPEDIAWQEARRQRKVRKLDFEVR